MKPSAATTALAPVSAVLALAARGSGSVNTAAATSTQFALTQCMRSHGVPNFAGPTFPQGGGMFRGKLPVDQSSPAFQQAVTRCNKQ